jgi:PAS domain-containing protein
MQDMRDHLEGRKALYETSYRIQAKDGSYTRFYDRGKIVGERDGEILLAGIVMDITTFNFTQR